MTSRLGKALIKHANKCFTGQHPTFLAFQQNIHTSVPHPKSDHHMIILDLSRQQTLPTLHLPTHEPPRQMKRFALTPTKQNFSTAIDSTLPPDIVEDYDDPDTIGTELNIITNVIVSTTNNTLPKKHPYQAANPHRCPKVIQIDKKLKALRQLRHAIARNYLQ
jgi:hypothetical protein